MFCEERAGAQKDETIKNLKKNKRFCHYPSLIIKM